MYISSFIANYTDRNNSNSYHRTYINTLHSKSTLAISILGLCLPGLDPGGGDPDLPRRLDVVAGDLDLGRLDLELGALLDEHGLDLLLAVAPGGLEGGHAFVVRLVHVGAPGSRYVDGDVDFVLLTLSAIIKYVRKSLKNKNYYTLANISAAYYS